MNIGRKIYYELATGNVILDTGERSGEVVEKTIDQDFATYGVIAERIRESVGVVELEYGEYAGDFVACNGYKVNVTSEPHSLEFSYPDPNEPQAPTVYRTPLSEQVAAQDQRLADIELALADLFTGGGV